MSIKPEAAAPDMFDGNISKKCHFGGLINGLLLLCQKYRRTDIISLVWRPRGYCYIGSLSFVLEGLLTACNSN